MRDKKTLLIASNNKHKIIELKKILENSDFKVISMSEAGFCHEIEETGTTFEENAVLKAKAIALEKHTFVFADDSGLEVEALDNRPGVYSARYAGDGASDSDRIKKLLGELKDKTNRNARFVCVIAISTPDGKVEIFRGEVRGKIIDYPKGENGFGYDPVFVPEGFTQTFAELESEVKNKISHRGKASQKMLEAIKTY
ncbi:MAG: XTP/dITP diphosphatase [Lentisphaerota bacterium]